VPRTINKIVVHCSDSPHGRNDGAEQIHSWHVQRGWSGIGYHYVINEHGILENGRPQYWVGAHVEGHNKDSIGICMIGVDKFTQEQFDTLEYTIRELLKKYPGATVCGHRDLDTHGKTCPNFDVKDWWAKVK